MLRSLRNQKERVSATRGLTVGRARLRAATVAEKKTRFSGLKPPAATNLTETIEVAEKKTRFSGLKLE